MSDTSKMNLYLICLGILSFTISLDGAPIENTHQSSTGLVAYDCAAETLNITTISLHRPRECRTRSDEKRTTLVHIQVIQQKAKHPVRVIQCSLMTERSITHCGMHSHASLAANSYAHKIRYFTFPDCKRLLDTRYYEFDHHT